MPALYVQALVFLPRLQVSNVVDFLVDTGADNTCLHPWDMGKLMVDYRKLRRNTITSSVGVGGSLAYFREEGQLVFRDVNGDVRVWDLTIRLSSRTDSPELLELPSLLGRDFINLCSFQADRSKNQVMLEPVSVVENWVGLPDTAP